MTSYRSGLRSAAVLPMLLVLLTMLIAGVSPADAAPRIGPRFFGLGIDLDGPTWPTFAPRSVRTGLHWEGIEREAGVYDWSQLDVQVETAEAHGAQLLLAPVSTPLFHAAGPGEPSYASPPDLNAYRAFMRALVTRYGSRVDYQVWNEANVLMFFNGTPAYMAQMTAVAGGVIKEIAPDATLLAPSFPLRYNRIWVRRYWEQRIDGRGVGEFVDAAALSVYPMVDDGPEESLELVGWMRRLVQRNGFDGPLWATEINFGANGLEPTRDIPMRRQASYVVRAYALHATMGADRVYWWQWEPHQTVNTELQDGDGNLTRAGVAYGAVKDWLVGTKARGCDLEGAVRTCRFRARDGEERVVMWSRSNRTRAVRAPEGATTRVRISGGERRVHPGQRVRVGLVPIMVSVARR